MSDPIEWAEFEFSDGSTGSLRARLNQLPDRSADAPIVMMLTGDGPKGSKSLSWANLPPLLASVGIRSFLFDFSGLGNSDGERRALTCDVGTKNLNAAFAFLRSRAGKKESMKIGAIASSFGANILLCNPIIANALSAIVLKSPAAHLPEAYFNEIGKVEFNRWRHNGFSPANGYDFSVFTSALNYNGYVGAQSIRSKCLITHGTKDKIVPFRQSVMLAACLQGQVRLELFEDVDHGYSEEGAWDRMAALYVSWLSQTLLPAAT